MLYTERDKFVEMISVLLQNSIIWIFLCLCDREQNNFDCVTNANYSFPAKKKLAGIYVIGLF